MGLGDLPGCGFVGGGERAAEGMKRAFAEQDTGDNGENQVNEDGNEDPADGTGQAHSNSRYGGAAAAVPREMDDQEKSPSRDAGAFRLEECWRIAEKGVRTTLT
jgi:hypothetical protein